MYAAVAAAIAGSLPRGSGERRQANTGALVALTLAMTAQVVSHLIESGYMTKSPGVVIAVSAVPPAVAAHVLHLTAAATRMTPTTQSVMTTTDALPKPLMDKAPESPPDPVSKPVLTPVSEQSAEAVSAPSERRQEPEVQETAEGVRSPVSAAQARQPSVTVPVNEDPTEPSRPAVADEIVRALYDDLGGRRPGTRQIVDALRQAGLPHSEGTARSTRIRVEVKEPALRKLPSA
ncbi:hypothetical protein [Streptomyces sp. CO7]